MSYCEYSCFHYKVTAGSLLPAVCGKADRPDNEPGCIDVGVFSFGAKQPFKPSH